MKLSGSLLLLLLTGEYAVYSGSVELDYNQEESNMTFNDIPDSNDTLPQVIFEVIRVGEINYSEVCSFERVLKHLDLTKSNEKFTLSRPVRNHKHLTWVFLDMKIYAILDMRERDQTFIAYIWIYLRWDNEHIWWDPEKFCGINHIIVPTQLLWKPDLTIEEMTEDDKAPPSPYVNIKSYGWVELRNDVVVMSTCRMYAFKFPFDIQSCNISFKSIMYSDKEIQLFYNENNSVITQWSRETLQTQYEWIFLNMSVTQETVNQFGFNQTKIIYTIKMKRRSLLYIVNFLLPVFFFLCLDLASFLISDKGGEKIGFKITVLLAVTVMQLILNDILPSSSDRIPLIALYCIGIFALMLLSLLETILVLYLINKDNKTEINQRVNENREDKQNNFLCCFKDIKTQSVSVDVSAETPSVATEPSEARLQGGSSHHTEVSLAFEKVSDELKAMRKTVALLSSRMEDEKPGYWTDVAEKINKGFTVFYVTASTLFLAVMFTVWTSE